MSDRLLELKKVIQTHWKNTGISISLLEAIDRYYLGTGIAKEPQHTPDCIKKYSTCYGECRYKPTESKEPDCYCICHSPLSSRPVCEHCSRAVELAWHQAKIKYGAHSALDNGTGVDKSPDVQPVEPTSNEHPPLCKFWYNNSMCSCGSKQKAEPRKMDFVPKKRMRPVQLPPTEVVICPKCEAVVPLEESMDHLFSQHGEPAQSEIEKQQRLEGHNG